jgi:hypothetical protein
MLSEEGGKIWQYVITGSRSAGIEKIRIFAKIDEELINNLI